MRVGQAAAAWELPDQDGQRRSLGEFAGHALVLYFYPRASTSGCTLEAQGFRDAYARYRHRHVAVVGASPDTVKAQKKFAEHERLPFPLLADAERNLCQSYGVLQEKSMYGRKFLGVVRTTVLIDGQGVVRDILAPVKPAGHAEAVLERLRELGLA